MSFRSSLFPLLSVCAAASLAAQGVQPPHQTPATLRGVGDTSIFAPLERSRSRRVSQRLTGARARSTGRTAPTTTSRATLDTAAKTLRGSLTLRYTNNSPDTLRFIWLQTEQNAFKANSLNSLVFAPAVALRRAQLRGRRRDRPASTRSSAAKRDRAQAARDNETVTKVDLAEPLAPGHDGDVRRRRGTS